MDPPRLPGTVDLDGYEAPFESVDTTLPDVLHKLEVGLSKALFSYRECAESALACHLDTLERMQAAHEVERATLRSENIKLRDMLGMKIKEPPQPILFQAQNNSGDPKLDGAMKHSATRKLRNNSEDDDDKKMLSARKGRKQNTMSQQQSGGTWQPFVAWVPNGVALQNPDPWKPLHPHEMVQLTQSCSPCNRTKSTKALPPSSTSGEAVLTMVVPSVTDPAHGNARARQRDDDEESGSSKSSGEGPERLELLEVWEPTTKEKKRLNSKLRDMESVSVFSGQQAEEEFAQKYENRSFFIINPDSNLRIVWDVASLIMVMYDMVILPMFVFDLPETALLTFMDWLTRLFWTFDMGWSCCTGIVLEDGTVEYGVVFILKRYAKTWLTLDLFIVGSDWAGLIFSSGGMGLSRLARVSRVARVVRLLRLVRMRDVFASITERIQSTQIGLAAKLVQMTFVLIGLAHVTACGWWGIGARDTAVTTWVVEHQYNAASISAQYLVSMHWALSQFAGGMDEVTPANPAERAYAIVVYTFGFMAALVMLSILTSNLTQQYIIGGSSARQMATLKLFLKQNSISKNLTKRLCRNAKHASCGDLTQDTVDLLSVISDPLKIEMHYEMYARILQWHPFFNDFLQQGNQVMRRVCHEAMSMLLLAHGDVVFTRGEEPQEPKMYIVVSGTLEYVDAYGEKTPLGVRQWAAEQSLWMVWRHRGTLTATNDVKLALLDGQTFQDICKRQMKKQKGGFTPKAYASAFVDELNLSSVLSDLPGPR